MSIHIVHNNKIDMTNEEYQDYQDICKSYDRANFKGEDLFRGLFHTDNKGMIIKIGIPSGQQTSMEVFLFCCALYEQQKMRLWEGRINGALKRVEERLNDLEKKTGEEVVEKS